MRALMADRDDDVPHLRSDRPAERVLRITHDGPGLNAVYLDAHRELGVVWLAIDEDPATNVLIRGARKAFSAGGSVDLVDELIADHAVRSRACARRAISCSTSSTARR